MGDSISPIRMYGTDDEINEMCAKYNIDRDRSYTFALGRLCLYLKDNEIPDEDVLNHFKIYYVNGKQKDIIEKVSKSPFSSYVRNGGVYENYSFYYRY